MQGAIGISMNSKRRIPYGNIVWRGKKKRNSIKQTNFPQTQKAKGFGAGRTYLSPPTTQTAHVPVGADSSS